MRSTWPVGGRGNSGQAGFTFLEIMMVVVIIGILAAIVGPKLAGHGNNARNGAAKVQIRNFRMGVSQFEMNTGRFPSTEEGLKALRVKPDGLDGAVWHGPYFDEPIPKDPWGHSYHYASPGPHGGDYAIWSDGMDGEAGTEDDLKSWAAGETDEADDGE